MNKNIKDLHKLNNDLMASLLKTPNVLVIQKLLGFLLNINTDILKDIVTSKELSQSFKKRLGSFHNSAKELAKTIKLKQSKKQTKKRFPVKYRSSRVSIKKGGAMELLSEEQMDKFTPDQLLKIAAMRIKMRSSDQNYDREMQKLNMEKKQNSNARTNKYIGKIIQGTINIGKISLPPILSWFMVKLISETVTELTNVAASATSIAVGAPIGAMMEGISHFYTSINNMASQTCKIGAWIVDDMRCPERMEYGNMSQITIETIDSFHTSFSGSLDNLDETKSVLLAKVALFSMILVMIYIFISVLRILLFSKEITLPLGFGVRLNSATPALVSPRRNRRNRRHRRRRRLRSPPSPRRIRSPPSPLRLRSGPSRISSHLPIEN